MVEKAAYSHKGSLVCDMLLSKFFFFTFDNLITYVSTQPFLGSTYLESISLPKFGEFSVIIALNRLCLFLFLFSF